MRLLQDGFWRGNDPPEGGMEYGQVVIKVYGIYGSHHEAVRGLSISD